MKVEECPAGLEMDAAVAKALGLQVRWFDEADGRKIPSWFAGTIASRYDDWEEHEDWQVVPEYSTNIAIAWELRHKAQGGYLKVLYYQFGFTEVDFVILADEADNGFRHSQASADTAPLAICRAFLKANGVTEIECSNFTGIDKIGESQNE